MKKLARLVCVLLIIVISVGCSNMKTDTQFNGNSVGISKESAYENDLTYDLNSDVLVLLKKKGISLSCATPMILNVLSNISVEMFWEMVDCYNEEDFDEELEEIKTYLAMYVITGSDGNEVSQYMDAYICDRVLDYYICVADTNANYIAEVSDFYMSVCQMDTGNVLNSGTYTGEIGNGNTDKSIKFNGTFSDLESFIQNNINSQAFNAYYTIVVGADNNVEFAYWCKNKEMITGDLKESYSWDMEYIENGTNHVIGTYPENSTYYNLKLTRAIKQSGGLGAVGYVEDTSEGLQNRYLADEMAYEEVERNLNKCKEKLGNSSYVTKSEIESLNAEAKQVHIAVNSCISVQNIDTDSLPSNAVITNVSGECFSLFLCDIELNCTALLGDDFKGYVYGEFDEKNENYYILYSLKPIPDEYKYKFTEQEQYNIAQDGFLIGCYPRPSN